jgi:ABC-type methionine transport system ATPase subunit
MEIMVVLLFQDNFKCKIFINTKIILNEENNIIKFYLKSIFVLAQGTDTIYFTGNIPNIYNSNTQKIIHHLFSKCNTTQKETYNEKIESNREFRTVSNLNLFNKESKTNIFTSADAVIISYFCPKHRLC